MRVFDEIGRIASMLLGVCVLASAAAGPSQVMQVGVALGVGVLLCSDAARRRD